jgi:hypothetical protein
MKDYNNLICAVCGHRKLRHHGFCRKEGCLCKGFVNSGLEAIETEKHAVDFPTIESLGKAKVERKVKNLGKIQIM